MDSKLALKVFCALAACWALAVAADDEEKVPGVEVTEKVQTDDGNGDITNDTIKWCDTEQKDKCECTKGQPTSFEEAFSTPENSCVKLNIGLGHTRYSALTESIMLQLNELVPNSALYSPSGFKVVAGFAVYSVSRVKNASGAPKYVTLTSPIGVTVTFEFADGESVGIPLMTTAGLADGRLAMADAQGWATATDPAFYDYYPGDGARWRFGAAVLSPDYMQFVEHRTPEGRGETRQDLGLEIVRDVEGCLRQVATPAWGADFLVTGQDAYDLKIYPNDASCVPGTRTEEGFLEITQDAVPGVIWEFRNPEPGVMRDLQVTKKYGTVAETWLYKYVEDVQDFTLVYPENAKQIRLEKYNSDSGKSRVVRRTVLGGDGKAFSAQEKYFDVSSVRSRLTKSVRDPGGLNLTRTYTYFPEGLLDGLPSLNVGEDGSWTWFEYDDQRRMTVETRPWLDAPTNAPVNQCVVTRYGYEFADAADFLRGGDKRPRTVTEEACGIEVARTYHAYGWIL